MNLLAAALALALATPPSAGETTATDSEGPTPGPTVAVDPPDPDDWWHRHDRRLRGAVIGLGAITGAAVLTTAATGAAANHASIHGDHARGDRLGLTALTAGAIGAASLASLISVGAALAVTRERGWRPSPVPPSTVDPRSVPTWVTRDDKLRRATIGLAAFTGAMLFGLGLTQLISRTRPACSTCFSEGLVSYDLTIITGTLAGAGAIALAGVGGALRTHRRPLRRWRAAPAPGGLAIFF